MSKSNTKRGWKRPKTSPKTFVCCVVWWYVLLQWVSGRAFFLSFTLEMTCNLRQCKENNDNNKEIFRRSHLSRRRIKRKNNWNKIKVKYKKKTFLFGLIFRTHTHPERESFMPGYPLRDCLHNNYLLRNFLIFFCFASFFKWKRENLSSRACNVYVSLF